MGADDLTMHLLHPLFWTQFNLPHPRTSSAEISVYYRRWPPQNIFDMVLHKAALSSSPCPSETTSFDCILMGIFHDNSKLAFCRLADDAWTIVELEGLEFDDIVYCKGKFYVITSWEGEIMTCNIGGAESNIEKSISSLPKAMVNGDIEKLYLVENISSESLLVVSRKKIHLSEGSVDCRSGFTYTFQVFEFNMRNLKWRELKIMGNKALFLGHNSSGSLVASDFPGFKANCIYFTDDFVDASGHRPRGGVMDMNIYHMENGTVERYPYTGRSYSHITPPMWVMSSFYVMGKWMTSTF